MARLTMLPLDGVESAATDGNLVNQDRLPDPRTSSPSGGGLVDLYQCAVFDRDAQERPLDLVRLRIAFHNQCRSCMSIRFSSAVDNGVDDELVCSLERPTEWLVLTNADRVALKYADMFATDHLPSTTVSTTSCEGTTTRRDGGAGLHCALCVGTGQMAATWNVVDMCQKHSERKVWLLPGREPAHRARGEGRSLEGL